MQIAYGSRFVVVRCFRFVAEFFRPEADADLDFVDELKKISMDNCSFATHGFFEGIWKNRVCGTGGSVA